MAGMHSGDERVLNTDGHFLAAGAESAPVSEPQPHGPNLVNKQMVLPFIPPKFPSSADGDEHSLIKPSEYLRALGTKPAPAPAPVPAPPPPLKAEPLPVVHTVSLTSHSMSLISPNKHPLIKPSAHFLVKILPKEDYSGR